MTLERNETHLIIIEPDGPQGAKLGLGIDNEQQFIALDEAMGALDSQKRHDVEEIAKVAQNLGIAVVKP